MGCKTIENPLGTETTIWNKHNTDKNPNWPEAKQLAIYKHGQEEEQGSTEDKSSNQYYSGSWTHGLQIATAVLQPLSHSASFFLKTVFIDLIS